MLEKYPLIGVAVRGYLPNKTVGQIQVKVKKYRSDGVFVPKKKGKVMSIRDCNRSLEDSK